MKIINVLLAALVAISRHYCCDAFQCTRTSSSNNRKVGYHEMTTTTHSSFHILTTRKLNNKDSNDLTTGMMMAKLPLEEEEKDETRTYTRIEDGSFVGVFTVAFGFLLVQYFGNTIENKDFINEYGVIIILLAGSTAAGISRFIRNK